MENLDSNNLFLTIIFIIGLTTIITDLKSRKIYNQHLLIGAVLGLVAVLFTSTINQENVLFHIINGLIGALIGYILYHFDLWRGGDAKLFILYAFIMPPIKGENPVFFGVINLFSCSFVAGAIIFLPFFIMNFFKATQNDKFIPQGLKKPFEAAKLTILFSWISFPFLHLTTKHLANTFDATIIAPLTTYFIFLITHRCLDKFIRISDFTIISGFVFGFLMRLLLNPISLSWPVLPYSILKIGHFSFLSSLLHPTKSNFKEHQDRVPFSPLLFIGCLLSYSPFLTWIRQLIYR